MYEIIPLVLEKKLNVQHILIENLLLARHCSKQLEYSSGQNRQIPISSELVECEYEDSNT